MMTHIASGKRVWPGSICLRTRKKAVELIHQFLTNIDWQKSESELVKDPDVEKARDVMVEHYLEEESRQ